MDGSWVAKWAIYHTMSSCTTEIASEAERLNGASDHAGINVNLRDITSRNNSGEHCASYIGDIFYGISPSQLGFIKDMLIWQ